MNNDKPQFVETLLERTMLFRSGSQQVIWNIPLETVEVDAHDVDEYLADGWYKHPFEVRDAAAAEAQRLADEAAAAEADRLRLAAEQEAQRKADEAKKKEVDDAAAADNELREKLIAQAEEMGLKIDKRWGSKTLQEAIDEAKKDK